MRAVSPLLPLLLLPLLAVPSVSLVAPPTPPRAALQARALSLARNVTQSWPYEVMQGGVALGLLSVIDAGFSGDWVKFGYITSDQEALARLVATGAGFAHIAFGGVAAVATWQRQQPITPALLKVLLIGTPALIQVLLQDKEQTDVVRFPWRSATWDGEPEEWAEKDSAVQKISTVFQMGPAAAFKQAVADASAGDYDVEAVDAEIDRLIAKNPVLVFLWRQCPFCKAAVELLEGLGAKFETVVLDDREDGKAIRARLGVRTGRTSVPSVWVGGEYLGGCNDGPGLVPLNDRGELVPKLQAVGALKRPQAGRGKGPFGLW